MFILRLISRRFATKTPFFRVVVQKITTVRLQASTSERENKVGEYFWGKLSHPENVSRGTPSTSVPAARAFVNYPIIASVFVCSVCPYRLFFLAFWQFSGSRRKRLENVVVAAFMTSHLCSRVSCSTTRDRIARTPGSGNSGGRGSDRYRNAVAAAAVERARERRKSLNPGVFTRRTEVVRGFFSQFVPIVFVDGGARVERGDDYAVRSVPKSNIFH